MSYAGPISRGTRVSDAESSRSETPPPIAARSRPSRGRLSPDTPPAAVIFAAGMAMGIAVGAAGALLLAPQSGADTRRALARRGRRLGLRGRDAWEDLGVELRRFARRRRRAWQHRRERTDED